MDEHGSSPRSEEDGTTVDPDLAGAPDVEHLLRRFYGRALLDPLLRPVFVDVAHLDLEAHLPIIAAFWVKVLFDVGPYSGRTMAVHRRLHAKAPLTEEHFARWTALWRETVRESFHGPVAEEAVAAAERMARVFLRNLQEPPAPGLELPIVG